MKGGNQTEPTTHKTELTFGLNSTKCPPQLKGLVPFEEDLIKLVKNLRLRKVDKKRTLSKEEYSNLLQNAITSKYKKTDKHVATSINKEEIKHGREANIIV